MATRKPNILFIQTDQHRRDALGCYGNAIVQTKQVHRIQVVHFSPHATN